MAFSFQKYTTALLASFFISLTFLGALTAHAQSRACLPGDQSVECTSGGPGATTNAPLPGTTVRPCNPSDPNCTPGQNTTQPVQQDAPGAYPTRAGFVPLTAIPGVTDGHESFGTYLNAMFRFLIGLAALLGVIKITFAGIQYMASETSFSSKEKAKEDISNSLLGLLIVLATIIIIQTINPNILNLDILRGADNITPLDTTYTPPPPSDPTEHARQSCIQNGQGSGVLPGTGVVICFDVSPGDSVPIHPNDYSNSTVLILDKKCLEVGGVPGGIMRTTSSDEYLNHVCLDFEEAVDQGAINPADSEFDCTRSLGVGYQADECQEELAVFENNCSTRGGISTRREPALFGDAQSAYCIRYQEIDGQIWVVY